jgi:hypothetical protein
MPWSHMGQWRYGFTIIDIGTRGRGGQLQAPAALLKKQEPLVFIAPYWELNSSRPVRNLITIPTDLSWSSVRIYDVYPSPRFIRPSI